MKKTIFVLNIDNYIPELTKLTYPFIERYAKRINANIHYITKRKFKNMPVTYEKLQIYELAKEQKNDWNIYFDSDALIHPETLDYTEFLPRDTVLHNASDMANIRWDYDNYFRRDGRNIGSCNWFAIASDLCIDLWAPLDLPLNEALKNIHPTVDETRSGIEPEHLIDDYVLSRNIAKFGLKFKSATDINKEVGLEDANFFHHIYTVPPKEKIKKTIETIKKWNLA